MKMESARSSKHWYPTATLHGVTSQKTLSRKLWICSSLLFLNKRICQPKVNMFSFSLIFCSVLLVCLASCCSLLNFVTLYIIMIFMYC